MEGPHIPCMQQDENREDIARHRQEDLKWAWTKCFGISIG